MNPQPRPRGSKSRYDLAAAYFDAAVGDIVDGLGEDDPLGLLHDAPLQYFGGISVLNRNGLLGDDGTFVHAFVYEVHR